MSITDPEDPSRPTDLRVRTVPSARGPMIEITVTDTAALMQRLVSAISHTGARHWLDQALALPTDGPAWCEAVTILSQHPAVRHSLALVIPPVVAWDLTEQLQRVAPMGTDALHCVEGSEPDGSEDRSE